MKALALLAGIALSASSMALAASEADTITMHSEVVTTPADAFMMIDRINVFPEASAYSEESVVIDQVINLGKKAWAIIAANKPVVNVKYNFANALPQGLTTSASLAGFSDLQTESVRLWGTNGFGMTVYDVTLTAVHQYGGSYNGKGKYLETVTILPSNVEVLWGYTVNYNVDNVTTLNGGTAEDPIAMIALQAKFKVQTVVKSSETNTVYQFRGDSKKVKTSGI
jgi:hypothetical protein